MPWLGFKSGNGQTQSSFANDKLVSSWIHCLRSPTFLYWSRWKLINKLSLSFFCHRLSEEIKTKTLEIVMFEQFITSKVQAISFCSPKVCQHYVRNWINLQQSWATTKVANWLEVLRSPSDYSRGNAYTKRYKFPPETNKQSNKKANGFYCNLYCCCDGSIITMRIFSTFCKLWKLSFFSLQFPFPLFSAGLLRWLIVSNSVVCACRKGKIKERRWKWKYCLNRENAIKAQNE